MIDNYDLFCWHEAEQNLRTEEYQEEVEKGYEEITTNEFVSEEDAYDYALERCLNGTEEDKQEFKEMLVEWFYSGNWVKRG